MSKIKLYRHKVPGATIEYDVSNAKEDDYTLYSFRQYKPAYVRNYLAHQKGSTVMTVRGFKMTGYHAGLEKEYTWESI